MGLFDRFKAKAIKTEPGVVYAPLTGKVIPIEEIPDPVFSQGIVGPGCGIEPEEGIVTAPFDGTVVSVTDTKHAVGLRSMDGIEILIHVGMDTVQMNGEGFDLKVKEGTKVHCGQQIMAFDMKKIKDAGYPTTTAVIVTNAAEYGEVKFPPVEHVEKGMQLGNCR